MPNACDVMVISAHPDDAEFGAAGTVAKWIREGRSVVYAVCTNGDKGTTDPNIAPGDLAAIREKEQRSAAGVLGVGAVVFLGHPDQSLEDTPHFRKQIVRLIREFRPHTVITSDPYRRYIWHRDHRIVGQVVLDAVYPYARDHLAYPDLMAQGIEPHKVKEVLFWGADDINYRSDITDTFNLKLSALQCHTSQIIELAKPDLRSWLASWCRKMAGDSPFDLAEAFHRVTID